MNTRGILTSFKGKGGGFALARSPEKIYLKELIKILQGPVNLAGCVFRTNVCPGIRTCRLRKIILRVQKAVVSELKSITLASLLEESASGKRSGGEIRQNPGRIRTQSGQAVLEVKQCRLFR